MDYVHNIASEVLKSFVDRIERLEEEKSTLAEDIKGVYAEAKATGFDVKILRKLISIRKMDEADFKEQQDLLVTYASALGLGIFA